MSSILIRMTLKLNLIFLILNLEMTGTCTISESGENCRICYSTCSIIPSFEVEFFDMMVNFVILYLFFISAYFSKYFLLEKTLN
jgi:hypothetical protein